MTIGAIRKEFFFPGSQHEYKPKAKPSESFAEILAEEERKLSVAYIRTMEVLNHERIYR